MNILSNHNINQLASYKTIYYFEQAVPVARKLPTSPVSASSSDASTTPPTPCSEGDLLGPDGTSDKDDLPTNDEEEVTNAITVHFKARNLKIMRENLKPEGKT